MDDNGVLHVCKSSTPSPKRPKRETAKPDSDTQSIIVGTEEANPIVFKPLSQASMKYLTSRFRLPCSSCLPYVNEGTTANPPPPPQVSPMTLKGMVYASSGVCQGSSLGCKLVQKT